MDSLIKQYSPPLQPELIIALYNDYQQEQPNNSQEEELTQLLSTLANEQEPSIINQVHDILPNIPITQIHNAIQEATEPNNLQQIINILLQHSNQNSEKPTKQNKNIRKKLKLDTIHLNDILQRETHKRLIEQAQQHHQKNTINNDWAIAQSQISYLANLLNIPIPTINSIYHRKNYNMVLTLEELLTITESQKRTELTQNQIQLQLQLNFLRDTLPSENDHVLTRLLIVTDLDPGNALDLWIFLDELHASHGNLPFNQFISNPTKSFSTALASSSKLQFSSSMKSGTQQSHNVRRATKQEIESSLRILRTRRTHLQERVSSSRQLIVNSTGTHSSQNKQAIQNSISAIYAEDSRKIVKQIQDWELQLAQKTVEERQKLMGDPNSLDLHGLTKHQAVPIVSNYLQSWWSNHSHSVNNFNTSFVHPFRIITGAGTHSTNSRPALLPTIINLLDREHWKWKPEDDRSNGLIGALRVVGKSHS